MSSIKNKKAVIPITGPRTLLKLFNIYNIKFFEQSFGFFWYEVLQIQHER